MRHNNKTAVVTIALLAIAGWTAPAGFAAFDQELYEQRAKYQRALSTIRTGRQSEFRKLFDELTDYPLHPYLVYHDASRQIASLDPHQISAYRKRLTHTPLAEILFQRWLLIQGRHSRWKRLAESFEGSAAIETRCLHLHALLRVGQKKQAMDGTPDLWLVGESQHKACDPVFAAWIREGHLTEDLAWQRLRLALEANSRQLARYLLRFFKAPRLSQAKQYYEVHVSPARSSTSSYFPDDAWGREALSHGLRRYALSRLDKAQALWSQYRTKYAFDENEQRELDGYFEFQNAREGTLPEKFAAGRSAETVEAIVDAAVSLGQWKEAKQWLSSLPAEESDSFKLQYWRGRAEHELGTNVSQEGLTELAALRTFYGFAAASLLGLPFALNEFPQPDVIQVAELRKNEGTARLLELFALGDIVNAKREWELLASELAVGQKAAIVTLIGDVGWTDQAIFAANVGGLSDLVSARFPLAYERIFRQASFTTSIDLPFLLAIGRQESAFMPAARSRAGALGVMQLMPATARGTAQRISFPSPSANRLRDPTFNIPLGAHHLAELMQDFGGHRALVAAAYNAGSSNARRWLQGASGMDTLAWVERITYRETRNYVKNVLAFSVVYANRLGLERPFLSPEESTIP